MQDEAQLVIAGMQGSPAAIGQHRLDLAVETIALRREFASIVPEEIKAAARAGRKRVERKAA